MDSGEKENREGQAKRTDEIYRISVSKDAEKAVVDLMAKVNQDFTAGQVNRSQLASWILLKFAKGVGSDELHAIRMDHVNELALLERVYREAKESGKVPSDVRDLMRRLAGIDDAQRRGSKKSLQKHVINDDISSDEGRGDEAHS